MPDLTKLPLVNDYGYYEIRLESIGGLGANLCGKILGELGALYLDLNSSSFASYGSEKKGSPVKSFIRWCDKESPIRLNSPIERPHLLGIFHDRMAGKEGVMAGVNEASSVVLNTAWPPEKAAEALKMHAGTLYTVDALSLAMAHKTRSNMVMLGALAKASGFIPLSAVIAAVEDTIGKKYPAALAANIAGINAGYESAAPLSVQKDSHPYVAYSELKQQWGYDNAPIGGIVPLFGSTISNDLTASREGYIPVLLKEKCIHCGLCDTTCPDMVFQFQLGEHKGKAAPINLGLDYHHCKGCLRCVSVCPVGALEAKAERDVDVWAMHLRNKDLIVDKMPFEASGASGWVNSESPAEGE